MATKKKGPEPLSAATIKNLHDKLYDKRKLGAVEVEVQVRELRASGQGHEKIVDILTYLNESFIASGSMSSRKGGLIAFAAAALGLGGEVDNYLQLLIPPVMVCLEDPDNKVRYYACESLFNITKVTRGGVLPYFNEIFGHLCTLAADPDASVRSAAELLDNLIKEIVTERRQFDVPKFVHEMLSKRIYVTNGEARKFLVSWIMVLDAVPGMDLVQYLPFFLDGLFKMLSDPSDEMRSTVVTALFELLKEMRHKPAKVNFAALVPILVPQCNASDQFQHVTSLTAMSWVSETIASGKEAILPQTGELLAGVLPGVSHGAPGVEDVARKANSILVDLVKSTSETIPISKILSSVQQQFTHQRVPTRLAALGWVLALQKRCEVELKSHIPTLFPVLIKMLTDSSEDVVRFDLKVLSTLAFGDSDSPNSLSHSSSSPSLPTARGQNASSTDASNASNASSSEAKSTANSLKTDEISQQNQNLESAPSTDSIFNTLIQSLIALFRQDRKLLEHRGNLIVRQLALNMSAEKIFRALAKSLEQETEAEFASIMIQTLNLILLTSTELHGVRNLLKTWSAGSDLFQSLYRSWAHNPSALLSLCLLSQVYQHASDLVMRFSELEITVTFLVEIDKLVQLLESPIYMYLRMQLLEADLYPYLFKTLFGILMLLPQSTAFETLKNRLGTVTSLGVMQVMPKSTQKPIVHSNIDFDALLQHFSALQSRHAETLRNKRLEAEKIPSGSASKKMSLKD